MNRYPTNSTAAQPSAEPFMVETRPPMPGAEHIQSHLFVPVGQTIFSALLLGLTVLAFGWRPGAGWLMTAIDAIWFARVFGWELVYVIERLLHRDITGDGQTGRPAPATPGVVVNSWQARQQAVQNEILERQNSLIAFWHLCAQYERPTEAAMEIPPDDRDGYAAYRDQLIKAGVAQWNNPQHHPAGWHLVGTAEDAAKILRRHVV